jgi:hypothetical protein
MALLSPENTIATKWILPGIADGVFRYSPLLSMLKKSCQVRYEGGPSWQENFAYDAPTVQPYTPGETFDLTQKQLAAGTTVTPRYYNVSVPALLEKLRIEMAGPRAAFNYIDFLLQESALALSARLANDAYRYGQVVGANDRAKFINGLDEALSDGATNGYLAQTYTSYLNVVRTEAAGALNSPMTGPAANVNGPLNYGVLEETFSSVSFGPKHPKWIITSNRGLSLAKMVFQPQQRFESVDADTGFMVLKFNGINMVADQYCPGTRVATAQDTSFGYQAIASGETFWFLNPEELKFYISTDSLFGFGFTGFMPDQGTSVVAGHLKFCGNLTSVGNRYQRYLFGVTS